MVVDWCVHGANVGALAHNNAIDVHDAVMCLSESSAYDGGDTPAHQFSCPEWLPRAHSYQRALRGSMLEM